MIITKDTQIFGSFAEKAGNNGCRMFNAAFEFHRIDAIYRSFSVKNIKDAFQAAKILGFSGFGVTMPFKEKILDYVDELSPDVEEIGACNTVVNIGDGKFRGYNTDYLAAREILAQKYIEDKLSYKCLYILGDGGYSKAVQYAAKSLSLYPDIIERKDWSYIKEIENAIIYNCTPVENIRFHESNDFIDCIITTDSGYELSLLQAGHQFKLYTGLDFPIK